MLGAPRPRDAPASWYRARRLAVLGSNHDQAGACEVERGLAWIGIAMALPNDRCASAESATVPPSLSATPSLSARRDEASPPVQDPTWARADVAARPDRRTQESRALDIWMLEPTFDDLTFIVRHAVRLRRIDVLEQVFELLRRPDSPGLTAAAAHELVCVPESARARSPRLTLLAAEAMAVLSGKEPTLLRMVSYVVRDASLHGHRWSVSDSPTQALWGGILLMMAQRQIPAQPAAEAIRAAWATHNRIDRSVAQFGSTGVSLDPNLVAVFHAGSALLALADADLPTVAAEAGFAECLQPWQPVRSLAVAARDVAASLSGQALARPEFPEFVEGGIARGAPWRHAMYSAHHVLSRLARAAQALNVLDRQQFERWFDQVSLPQAVGAGCWSLYLYLKALHDRIWHCNLAGGLAEFEAAVASCSLKSSEGAEPLGRSLIGRARSLLLSGLGATGPALAAVDDLPGSCSGVGRAVALIGAGDLEGAAHHAEAALYASSCSSVDRACLLVVHAAATVLLPGQAATENRQTTVTAMGFCLRCGVLAGLALLPKGARIALLDAYAVARDEDPSLDDIDLVLTRLADVVDTPHDQAPSIELTPRERVLLPMLASADSVPEIARELHVSANTVRKQVVTLRAKLGARTRSELVRRARNLGLLPGQVSGPPRGY